MKTTIAGVLTILGGVIAAAVQYLTGHPLDATLITTVVTEIGRAHV